MLINIAVHKNSSFKTMAGVAICLIGISLSACGKKTEPSPAPPPQVTVAYPIKKTVPDYLFFTGNLEGVDTVEIRARVKGFIQAINAKPGTDVKAGDLLFTIDPAPYLATLNARKGTLVAAKASAKNAQITYQRMQTTFNKGAVSRADLDKSIAQRDVTAANVKEAEAAVKAAQLDIEYTHVTAPIDGRIGLNQVDQGALVGADDATLLTTLLRCNELKVRFDATENQVDTLLPVLRARATKSGQTAREEASKVPVQLAIGDSGEFIYPGYLFSRENTFNIDTGTITIEARFKNADHTLIPGSFVRLRLVLDSHPSILVPEVAINRDQVGPYLLLVTADNKVARRDVLLGAKVNDYIKVDKGLTGKERVIVNGLQRARPGFSVTPIEQPKLPAKKIEATAPH